MVRDGISRVWEERVRGTFVYRGMVESDLAFPLDPSCDPHEEQKPLVGRFLGLLDRLLESGHQFEVKETHFGVEYRHNPEDLARWTRRDLGRAGIDFTSDHRAATEYADCWQGSQMKQNLRSLCQHLLDRKKVLSRQYGVTRDEWGSVEDISAWLREGKTSRPIVLHLAADTDLFARSSQLLPLGSLEGFSERAAEHFGTKEIDASALESALPCESDDFICTADRPLADADIARIEHVD